MLTEQLKPYIGVTGPTRINEATLINRVMAEGVSDQSSHQGMVGYLVSYRTLAGVSEGRSRYPAIETLPDLLKATKNPAILNMIHYRPTSNVPLSTQINQLFDFRNIYADQLVRAIQINASWPDVKELEKVRLNMPDLKVAFALTPSVLSSEDDSNKGRIAIQSRLAEYKSLIDYILVDFSGGKGMPFSSQEAGAIYRAIVGNIFKQPVIFGGGFDDQNLHPRLDNLSEKLGTKQWGIDAEGGLRSPRNDDKTSILDLTATSTYLRKAMSFFNTPYEAVVDFTTELESN